MEGVKALSNREFYNTVRETQHSNNKTKKLKSRKTFIPIAFPPSITMCNEITAK